MLRKAENNARGAMKALGLNYAGVDIIFDANEKDIIVIEINTFPGFPKMKRFNLPRQIIKEIGKRRWK